MGTDENKALVRRLVGEFLNQRRPDVVDEIFADDFVDHQGALGPTGDRGSVKDFVRQGLEAFPDMQFEINDLIAEGDLVFVRLTGHGTHRGDVGGVGATGRTVVAAVMSVVRVASGRIAERWNISDVVGLMQQIAPADGS